MDNMQFLYINGDSWLVSNNLNRVTSSEHALFKNIVVINHSVPGSGNLSIINRTKTALAELKKYNIKPWVCIGLSEVGRDFNNEFGLVRPQSNLTTYLESILIEETNILKQELVDYQHYICTSWTHNPLETKSIIDFIEEDFNKFKPVYTVNNGLYNWIHDRMHILKISKESFVDAVDNKQIFEAALLNNLYVDETLHLGSSTSKEVYEKFFSHVLSTFEENHDN